MKKLLAIVLIAAVMPFFIWSNGLAQDKPAETKPEKSIESQRAEAYLTLSNIQGRILVIQNIIDSLQKDKITLKDLETKLKDKLTSLNKTPEQ